MSSQQALIDLSPAHSASPNPAADARLSFRCPTCRRGTVIVDIRLGGPESKAHGVSALPPRMGEHVNNAER